MALTIEDAYCRITSVAWNAVRGRLRIRWTAYADAEARAANDEMADNEKDITLPAMISMERNNAARMVDHSYTHAIQTAAQIEIDRQNRERTEAKQPILTGSQEHAVRTSVREQFISKQMQELGKTSWGKILKLIANSPRIDAAYVALKRFWPDATDC